MGQRVNIQYSVDLEDLEVEVSRMIKQTGNKLEQYGEDLGHTVGISGQAPCLTLKTLRKLLEFREGIAKIDYKLEDITNIISGYIRYEVQPAEETNPTTSEEPHSPEPSEEEYKAGLPPNMEQMQQLIDNFKSSMTHGAGVQINEVSD